MRISKDLYPSTVHGSTPPSGGNTAVFSCRKMGGHLGVEKTVPKIKERFYWPGIQHDVTNWCGTCSTCATNKKAPQRNCAPL